MADRRDAGVRRSPALWLLPLGFVGVVALILIKLETCPQGQVDAGTPEPVAVVPTAAPTGLPTGTPEPGFDPRKLERAAVSGTVRDPQGQAIAGAQVCALTGSQLLDARETLRPPCAQTERDGHYRIEGLWAVRYRITAGAPGRVPAFHVRGVGAARRDTVDLRAGTELREVDVVLEGGGVEIHGVVRDLSGGPVEGASVTSGGLFYGTGMAVATSGAEGEFSLWVRPGAPSVWAQAEGYANGGDTGAAPGHQFEVFLTPEAVLVGKVIRAGEGTAVAGARVTAERGDTFFGGGSGGAITDAGGNFRLAQLTPGAYKPSVKGDDVYGMAAEQVVLGLGETSTPIVIEAHPAALVEGTVVIAGGASCPGGSVQLKEPTTGRVGGGEVEADGLVRIRALLPGTYGVTVRCEGFVSAGSYEPVKVADAAVTGLRWEVSQGRSIAGMVVSAKGEPVAGISVVGRVVGDKAGRGATGYVDTDRAGRFELAGISPGKYELRVFARSEARAAPDKPVEVTVPEAEDLKDVVITMLAAGELRGEVRDAQGQGVGQAQVRLQAPGRRAPTVRTADDGSFHVPELAPGEYRVTASRDGVTLRAPGTGDDDVQGVKVAVEADAVASVKLVVETGGGKIAGVVREAGGGVVSDAFVEVNRESESAMGPGGPGVRWFEISKRPHLTDVDGRFAIEALSPGKYSVRAFRRGGGEATAEHVALGAEVALEIAATGRMAGTVTLAGGGAPQDFTVTISDPATGFRRKDEFFRTGGAWSFSELPPGNFKIEVEAAEGSHKVEMSLGAGEERSGVRVALVAKVTVRGTVVDLEGAPVAGVGVRVSGSGAFVFDETEAPRTDAKGRFEVAGAPAGPVMLLLVPLRDSEVQYSQTRVNTRIAGGPVVELPPIRIATQKVKSGEAIGDLGYALKLGAPAVEPAARKLEVAIVRAGGPAGIAGLQQGDEIVTVDGEDVTGEQRHLYEPLTKVPPGTVVRLGLARGVTIEVTSGPPL